MNILVSAYACAPNMGSEPGMAWNWIANIAKHCRVFVITEGEWQAEINLALNELPHRQNISFYYIPVSENIRKMCRNQGDWRFYYYYHKWQKKALSKAKEICGSEQIDILHQLNMIGYREPGLLSKIKNIPIIWGPVGGFGSIPVRYTFDFGLEGVLKQILKNLLNKIQVYQPNVYSAIKKADLILAATSESKFALQSFRSDEVLLMNETGAGNIIKENKNLRNNSLKLMWIGKYDNRKALPLALKTMNDLRQYPIELHIIGIDKSKVNESLLTGLNKVYFYSWISHQEVQEHFQQCHALLFTSLNEGTPHVVIEALSNGLPVICHDIYGQGDVIDESCGIKIEMETPKKSISGFSKAILKLYNERDTLEKLSKGAYARAIEISWDSKARFMFEHYKKLITDKKTV